MPALAAKNRSYRKRSAVRCMVSAFLLFLSICVGSIAKAEIKENSIKLEKESTIFSAIEFLSESSRLEAEVKNREKEALKEIILKWNAGSTSNNPQQITWIEEQIKKAINDSTDLEKTYHLLDESGLKEKLLASDWIKEKAHTPLKLMLKRKPLPSFSLGSGDGQTARELASHFGGKDIAIAHDAKDLDAWISITNSQNNKVNALISDDGRFGPGFYALEGTSGSWQNGFTVKMTLDPSAKIGSDFLFRGEEFIILNRNAIRLMPIHKLSTTAFFETLLNKEIQNEMKHSGDLALIALKERQLKQGIVLEEELKDAAKLIEDYVKKRKISKKNLRNALSIWSSIPSAGKHSEDLLKTLKEAGWGELAISAGLLEREGKNTKMSCGRLFTFLAKVF